MERKKFLVWKGGRSEEDEKVVEFWSLTLGTRSEKRDEEKIEKKGHESLLGAEHKYHSEGRKLKKQKEGEFGQLGNLMGSWRRN